MILLLLLLLSLPVSAQVSSGGGVVGIAPLKGAPAVQPTFWHKMNTAGVTQTAFLGDNCTLSNGVQSTFIEYGTGNFAADFDADNDLFACGTNYDAVSASPFTVTAWIKADTYGETGVGRILGKSSSGNTSWTFFINSSANILGMKCATNTSNAGDIFQSDANSFNAYIGLSTLTFVAGSCSCTVMACTGQLYINGAAVNTTLTTDTTTGTQVDDSAYTLQVGSLNSGGNTFDGSEDDVRLYPAVLSATEILWIYLGGHQ